MATACDVFWKLFKASGHIGAYLLYREYREDLQANMESSENAEGIEAGLQEAAPATDEVNGFGAL